MSREVLVGVSRRPKLAFVSWSGLRRALRAARRRTRSARTWQRSRVAVLALAAGVWAGPSAFAQQAGEPTYQQLNERVQQLESRLAALEREPRERIGAAVDAAKEDAASRDAVLAGWDRGFFLKSADGNFLLRPGVAWQFRSVTSFDDGLGTQNGFENRRLRVRFDGHVFAPELTYSVVLDASRNGGGVTPLDVWGQYQFADEWAFRFGQWRTTTFLERGTAGSGFSLLAADRSIADAALGGGIVDRIQGVQLIYGNKDTPLRFDVSFHDGANSRNSDFRDPAFNPTNWGFGGRVEYKLLGEWAGYRDLTAKGVKEELLVLGAGFDNTERAGSNALLTTVDLLYKSPQGLSAAIGLHYNLIDVRGGPTTGDRTDFGGFAQLGYAIPDSNWEPFVRYALVSLDDDFVTGVDQFQEITAGVNYYFGDNGSYGQRAKATLDVGFLPDGAAADYTGLGIRGSDDLQLYVRGQFQLQL